jgi:Mg-chelatase subunit ChlD
MKRRVSLAALILGLPLVLAAVALTDPPPSAIDYQGVLRMLREGRDEGEILRRLQQSPTQFTLDAQQVRELKAAGASDTLLWAMQQPRITMDSDVQDYALILDCSGSMADQTTDGVTKMEAAKKAIIELIQHLPNRKRLTFLVYGHNLEEDCDAVKVVCSRRVLDDAFKAQLAQMIAPLKPLGRTPIAKALRMTGQELSSAEGLCEIVLLTDGMESCKGDPAAEARKLASERKLLDGVNVIGFDMEPREREGVRRISEAGKGKYFDARNADELRRKAKELEDNRRRILAQARKDAEDRARLAQQMAENKAKQVRTTQGHKIRFPAGDISWADRVVSYKPGNPAPRRSRDPKAALGPPDFQGRDDAADQRRYVNLGPAGELILEFTDNVLIDGPGPDLVIFEVGDQVAPVNVAISEDGKNWFEAGQVAGNKAALDIASVAKPWQRFRFVWLTDATGAGAKIDAVGCIHTLPRSER